MNAQGKVQDRDKKVRSFEDKIHGAFNIKMINCYKVYILANEIIYQNQSLFLALKMAFFLQLYTNMPKTSQLIGKKVTKK